MSGAPISKNSMGNTIKIYLFPALVTVLATLIWRDVTEMRSDIKALLAQSNIDKTEIQNLKRDVQILNHEVFKTPMGPVTSNTLVDGTMVYRHDKYFRHQNFYSINDIINE
jgi:guanylate kinase